jgi:hypothetical protein
MDKHELIQILNAYDGEVAITEKGSTYTIKLVKKKTKSLPTKEMLQEWCQGYLETFGTEYNVSYGKDTALMKKLLERYGVATLHSIFSVVFRHWDRRWKQSNFLRPTIGMLSSWLAEQAAAFAIVAEKQPEETTNETDLLNDLETKGWL